MLPSLYKVIFCLVNFNFIYVNCEQYIVPDPKVEVFSPKGFQVSIEDSPGIRLFAFHGNINEELRDLEAGVYSKDIVKKRRGRWTFVERRTSLKVGDVIYYWVFVIKNGLGYRLDSQQFVVRELVQNANHAGVVNNSSNILPTKPETCIQSTETSTLSEDNEMSSHLQVCEQTVLNITQVLLNLQEQTARLESKNQQLMQLYEKLPDAKTLTLSGVIPVDEDAITTVKFVIREKLSLNPDVVTANRISNTVITFNVASLNEKLEILKAAKEMLIQSRIVIS